MSIKTGKPDTRPNKPSHVRGVRRGNEPGSLKKSDGIDDEGHGTARRSTSINPEDREPIDPAMPNLSPP